MQRTSTNLNPRSVFIVYSQADDRAWTTPFTSAERTSGSYFRDGLLHGHNDDTQVFNATYTEAVVRNGTNLINGGSANFLATGRPKIPEIHTHIFTANQANTSLNYYIGIDREKDEYGRKMTGNIAEIIVYSNTLTAQNRERVESYLAIKYGITLNQSPARSYVLSDGKTAWNSGINATFNKDIAGFGRDDAAAGTTLNTLKAQSINNPGDIVVEANATFANLRTFMWANNGAGTGTWQTTQVPTGLERIPRAWQFQEINGDVGTVTVSYPASSLPSGPVGTPLLLVSTNAAFPTASTSTVTGSLVGGNWQFSVNLAGNAFATIGRSAVPNLPPALDINFASGSLMPSGNFSRPISYS